MDVNAALDLQFLAAQGDGFWQGVEVPGERAAQAMALAFRPVRALGPVQNAPFRYAAGGGDIGHGDWRFHARTFI